MPYTTFVIKQCPICKTEFTTKNRTKKTCSRKCAGISTIPFQKPKSLETRKKLSLAIRQKYEQDNTFKQRVSEGLKRYYQKNPNNILRKKKLSKAVGKGTRGKFKQKTAKNILDFSSRTIRKVLNRLEIGCSICRWNKDVCDIHHINGRKIRNADDHWNLCYLCPNCHRLTHSGKIQKCQLINLDEFIGERWKDCYYG